LVVGWLYCLRSGWPVAKNVHWTFS